LTTTLTDANILLHRLRAKRVKPVRLYYLDESSGDRYYARSALGIDAEVWSDAFYILRDWRKHIRENYSIPLFEELHAYDLLHGKGMIVHVGKKRKNLSIENGVKVFVGGLGTLEKMADRLSGHVEIINVCLDRQHKYDKAIEIETLSRISNRIDTSSRADSKYAFLIFDEGKEREIVKFYRRATVYNPIQSKYKAWEDGSPWKNIPLRNVVGGPAFRASKSDYFIQMADFVAHALLKQAEEPTPRIRKYHINEAFDILDLCLNKKASEDDPKGVVRF